MHEHCHPRWRFRDVELNAVGWAALLSPAALAAAGIAAAAGAPVPLVAVSAAAGGSAAWLVALRLEHRRSDRQTVPMPVIDAEVAMATLRSAGIAAVPSEVVDREGRSWSIVTVRQHDVRRARALVPWPSGRRSGRRHQRAQRAAWEARRSG